MARFSTLLILALFAVLLLSPTNNRESSSITFVSAADAADESATGANTNAVPDDDLDDADEDEADDDLADIGVEDEDDDEDDQDDEDDEPAEAGAEDAAPEPDKPAVIDPPGSENDSSYSAPDVSGAVFFDNFQSGLSKWVHTSASDYNGEFVIGQGGKPTIKGDRALIIPQKARKYGLTATFAGMEDLSAKAVVVQYELKLEQGMTCGGAYVKLPLPGFNAKEFDGSTPYSIMFGPDKCGSTDKVHFIFQSENPSSGKKSEHHLKSPPSVANTYDRKTHLYTLAIEADGKFQVLIDGEKKVDGTLSDSFEPPVQPAKEIDDPEDRKPADWVDTAKIPDSEAKKPDDWDEEAPAMIPDMDAKKPEGWLDDEPKQIPDPEAKKPEEWSDEEDGEWEAKKVPNPKCEDAGCGEWERPKKANPDYKGKWMAPMIDNPEYLGEWKPRTIANPEYYEVKEPKILGFSGLGFEIWTMDQGVLFDNIWIGSDIAAAKRYADATFSVKQKAEMESEKKEEAKAKEEAKQKGKSSKTKSADKKSSLGPVMDKIEDFIETIERVLEPVEAWLVKMGAEPYLDKLIDLGIQKPMLVVLSVPLLIVALLLIIFSGSKKKQESDETESEAATDAAEKKKTDAVTTDVASVADADASAEGDSTPAGEETSEETSGTADKTGVRRRRQATPE